MSRLFPGLAACLLAVAVPQPAQAQDVEPEPSAFASIEETVLTHQLDNGWTFLIVPRHTAPVVSFHTYIDVGSIFEDDGATGMAHMFEHMAFKGSDRIGTKNWPKEKAALDALEAAYLEYQAADAAGEEAKAAAAHTRFEAARAEAGKYVEGEAFSRVLEEAGGSGSLNASTSAEATRYVVSLPSNRVETWAWLERERFARPVLREFYKERDAVLEERRMRVESSPFGALVEALFGTAFVKHPYRRPTIGYAADLQRYTRTEAEAFYAKNYGVRRFVTAIVGDVDPEKLIPLLDRYFGDLPPGPEPTTVDIVEPPQKKERRVEVVFPAMPLVMIGWHVPALSAPDYAALDLGLYILAQAQTSRLETSLVRGSGQAAQLGSQMGLPGDRYPNLALVFGIPPQGVSTAELEEAIYTEIAGFIEAGPTEDKLAGARTTARAGLIRQVADNATFAADLCEWQSKTGDWKNVFRRTEAYKSVTADEVKAALARYFRQENRTVATLVPPAPEPAETEE
jgi:predicted Zn-dependent peptidase